MTECIANNKYKSLNINDNTIDTINYLSEENIFYMGYNSYQYNPHGSRSDAEKVCDCCCDVTCCCCCC